MTFNLGNRLHILICFWIISLLLLTSTASADITNGLTAFYPFNGNANDESGAGNPAGIVYGASLAPDRFGNQNSAYYFNGISDYIRVPYSANFNLNPAGFTVAVWAKADVSQNANDFYDLIDKSHYSPGPGSPGTGWAFQGGEGNFSFAFYSPYGEGVAIPDVLIRDNTWHQLTSTFDGTTLRLFLDGALKGELVKSAAVANNANPLYFGKHYLFGRYYRGALDDFRMYNRALSDTEVQILADKKLLVSPVAYDFGTLTVGESSAGEPQVIYNSGPNRILIGTVTVSGPNAADFSITEDACSGQYLNSQSSCTVSTTFSPTTAGVKNGVLVVPGDSASAQAALSGLAVTQAPVAWWKAEGNAKDEMGYNNGTLQGGTTFAAGKIGQAFSLDGVDDYILVGDPVPLSLQLQREITLEAWIYMTEYPVPYSGGYLDLGLIVGSQFDTNVAGATIFIDGRANSDGQPSPPGHIHFQIGDGAWHQTNANSQVPLNQWVHVAATRKANEDGKIYYNGVLQPSTSLPWGGNISYSGAWFAIGQQKDLYRPFEGLIDEVKIYNRALSAEEVMAEFQGVGAATHFAVSAPASAIAGSAFSITVTALDDNGRTATGYTGTIHFTSSDANALLPADATLTGGSGTFSATLMTAGTQTITATDRSDASINGTSSGITVTAGTATHFNVVAPAAATAGQAFTFTVTALDAGDNTATGYTGTVRFTSSDGLSTLPADASLTNGAGTFSATLRTTGNQTVTATDTVSATITGTSDTIVVSAANAPDLTITKSHNGDFRQGQTNAVYTIRVRNSGNAPTAGTVTVTDTLPVGLTATAINGSGWSCSRSTLTCTRTNALAAGSSYPSITVTVKVAANAPASVTNTATVSGGGETDVANDTATDPTTITAVAPDLTIRKTHQGDFVQGQTGVYYIGITNSGNAATNGTVAVRDTLPAGLTATRISGYGWSCNQNTLTCTRSDRLAAGGTYNAVVVTVKVAADAPSSVINTATVSGGAETNTANDTASDLTTIIPPAPDLTITKAHAGNFRQGQTGGAYTITVSNSGTAPTIGTVTVTDTLPAGLTATRISGTGWSCSLGTLTCTRIDPLAAGASYQPITLTVNVASNAPSMVTNTATVSGGGTTRDYTATNPTRIVGR